MAKKEPRRFAAFTRIPRGPTCGGFSITTRPPLSREDRPRALAIEVLTQRRADIKQETFFPELIAKKKKRAVTLEEAFKSYIEGVKSQKITWKEDERYATHFLKAFGKDTPVTGLTPLLSSPGGVSAWRATVFAPVR